MTTTDPTAVRADAIELSESASAWMAHNDDPDDRDEEDYRWWQLQSRVADAYLALADPTPLAVEVLVGMGFAYCDLHYVKYVRGPITVTPYDTVTHGGYFGWTINIDDDNHFEMSSKLQPRTAGELRQLLLRLES